jgi:hypothetical protein
LICYYLRLSRKTKIKPVVKPKPAKKKEVKSRVRQTIVSTFKSEYSQKALSDKDSEDVMSKAAHSSIG